MLFLIGRDDRVMQLQQEEESSGDSSPGEDSDSEDELPFSMSRTGLSVLIFGLLVAGLSILLAWIFWRRQFRIQGHRRRKKPAFILKMQQLWCKWIPGAKNKGYYTCDLEQQEDHPMTTAEPAVGIARTTSERSVLTLPAYTSSARPEERIIGREGERGGVDVVLEYPETAEEEESRREEEMASLYNIRLARRAEREARQAHNEEERERRQLHPGSATHSRGSSMLDVTTASHPSSSHTQTRNSTGNETTSSETLLANHQAALLNRERRTSSVAYNCVGVAHHDGTRIQHNSNTDGDAGSTAEMPLLGSAASMGGGAASRSSRPVSNVSTVSMISRGSTAGLAASSAGAPIPVPGPVLGIATPPSGSASGSTQRSSSGSASANGAAAGTILTPPALSDDSLDDGHGVVTTPPDDHQASNPPQYDTPPPTYEDPVSVPASTAPPVGTNPRPRPTP